jgi:hypothetical protein
MEIRAHAYKHWQMSSCYWLQLSPGGIILLMIMVMRKELKGVLKISWSNSRREITEMGGRAKREFSYPDVQATKCQC